MKLRSIIYIISAALYTCSASAMLSRVMSSASLLSTSVRYIGMRTKPACSPSAVPAMTSLRLLSSSTMCAQKGHRLFLDTIYTGNREDIKRVFQENPDLHYVDRITGKDPLLATIERSDSATLHLILERIEPEQYAHHFRNALTVYEKAQEILNEYITNLNTSEMHIEYTQRMTYRVQKAKAIIEILLEKKVFPHGPGKKNPLHLAAEHKNFEIGTMFGSWILHTLQGIDSSLKVKCLDSIDMRGYTPLDYACEKGNINLVRLLIGFGASVSGNGNNPLHLACDRGRLDVAEELLKNGADINAPDSRGRSPLHQACVWKDTKVMSYLLRAGADPDLKDKEGRLPDYYLSDPYYERERELLRIARAKKAEGSESE